MYLVISHRGRAYSVGLEPRVLRPCCSKCIFLLKLAYLLCIAWPWLLLKNSLQDSNPGRGWCKKYVIKWRVTFWGLYSHRIRFLPSPVYLLGMCKDFRYGLNKETIPIYHCNYRALIIIWNECMVNLMIMILLWLIVILWLWVDYRWGYSIFMAYVLIM